MMNIEAIVKNNLCTGCGACISEDESRQAKMIWDENGFLVPKLGVNSTQEKIVDHLFIVKEKNGEYSYQFFSNFQEITKISKTRYVPVTMAELFEKISTIDGKVAISGVACFVKAVRLKQYHYPELKEKIPFVVGIICGGLKSKFYTDFLAQSAGCFSEYQNAEYRVKNKESFALDYKFSCVEKNNNKIHMVEMKTLGDMWGTGLFKSNACDFCDDVVTELADISLGDAWIDPYDKSGLGNSIVITRSKKADHIISLGVISGDLQLNLLNTEKIIQSQSGSYNHRHKGLLFRVRSLNENKKIQVNKRKQFLKDQNFLFNIVQKNRLLTREKSINFWKLSYNIVSFNRDIKFSLFMLALFTKINHRYLWLKKKLKGVH